MNEDVELIQKFKNGQLQAFQMLVKKYQNTAINIAYSLVNNRQDAEDIAQESFIKVYRSIDSFKAEAQFSSWLYRIIVNTAYDFLRRKKHIPVSSSDIEYMSAVDPKGTEDPCIKELIRDALIEIPFEYRSALVLREIEGLSYEEIARALKISIGTVESRIFRGRTMLKDILIKKGVLKNEV